MIAGDWAFNLKFRETDFLIDYPPVFNAMLGDLRQRASSDIEDLKAIESASSDDEVLTTDKQRHDPDHDDPKTDTKATADTRSAGIVSSGKIPSLGTRS